MSYPLDLPSRILPHHAFTHFPEQWGYGSILIVSDSL